MKIAIASSGLGHVSRGIETWARDTAEVLVSRGVDVTLFGAHTRAAGGRRSNEHLTPNPQPPTSLGADSLRPIPSCKQSVSLKNISLRCWKRYAAKTQWLTKLSPGWTWRWGFKNAYGWEQWSFWRNLKPELVRGGFDILHVQDPMVAYWCNLARKRGHVRTREILAHGTEELPPFLKRFDYVQHLAPWHLEHTESGGRDANWVAIPNFVDTDAFRPAGDDEEKEACRRVLGIPEDAFVIGTAAAVKKSHKRIDYLIREFAGFLAYAGADECLTQGVQRPARSGLPPVHSCAYLVIAGARQPDTGDLIALARELAGDRIQIILDVPRKRMPDFYRSLDLFVLSSLFEMMPIAVLEALASGVPVVTNRHPVLEWMVGDGGLLVDMSQPGCLSRTLCACELPGLRDSGRKARCRAQEAFAREVVVGHYIEYYERVLRQEHSYESELRTDRSR